MLVNNRSGNPLLDLVFSKGQAFIQLLKFRLSMLVAVSAVFGYVMAAGRSFGWWELFAMGSGGLLITGASNVLNQIFEKGYDARMKRTAGRPLPTGRLSDVESLVYALLLAFAGIAIVGYFFNLPAALLGIIGLLSYAFVYTPMKRISSISVFIGAIPGALPPLIGWVAFTGSIDTGGLILFAFQFFWQFPHFWAIAWILDEDYQRAGFKMLPSSSGKSSFSALLILIYTLSLVPLTLFPLFSGMVPVVGAVLLGIAGLLFALPAFWLYRSGKDKAAKILMFSSFLYLPVIQVIFIGFIQ
jgi:protoheme IX farnesyltransferase